MFEIMKGDGLDEATAEGIKNGNIVLFFDNSLGIVSLIP